MLDNKNLTTIIVVVLAIFILSPSLTGNYNYRGASASYENECPRPGVYCAPESTQYQGYYKTCTRDANGILRWSVVNACETGQYCANKYNSQTGTTEAKCLWRHQPNQ